ncbi:hypothetical protein NDU88_003737 [Pleurodeles waltl]|uniref:Uncharacterized protein n=1 Tax=Pleurodeles waltl TaxID=8319 RepID=A0AAV7VI66_PLEWA|nr:hypothetical protein NDU88_003737 [Pleurodeles waltl]
MKAIPAAILLRKKLLGTIYVRKEKRRGKCINADMTTKAKTKTTALFKVPPKQVWQRMGLLTCVSANLLILPEQSKR